MKRILIAAVFIVSLQLISCTNDHSQEQDNTQNELEGTSVTQYIEKT